MKQLAFTPECATSLANNIESNIDFYSKDAFVHPELNTAEQTFESSDNLLEDMLPFCSSDSKIEFKAAVRLYEGYKDITPLQASYKPFWLYLSHVTLYKYMCQRWPEFCNKNLSKEDRIKQVKDHFFNSSTIRNHIEGLYWTVKGSVYVNDDGSLNYSNTELLFRTVNVSTRAVAASSLFRNPIAVKGILRYIKDHIEDVYKNHFQARTSYSIQLLNRKGAVVELSLWSEQDFYDFLDSYKDEIPLHNND